MLLELNKGTTLPTTLPNSKQKHVIFIMPGTPYNSIVFLITSLGNPSSTSGYSVGPSIMLNNNIFTRTRPRTFNSSVINLILNFSVAAAP
jgi:hypothetical protein